MIDVEQRRLRALQQDRSSGGSFLVKKVAGISYERSETFYKFRSFVKDLLSIQRLSAIGLDETVGVFQVALNARTQHLRRQSIRDPNTPAAGFVFVRGPDPAQCRANPFITQTLFAGVIQRAMIRKNQMRARTDLHSLRRYHNPLSHQSIGFFEEGFRIDHHAVAQHARFSLVHDAGRQQVEHKGLVTDLNRMARVMPALITGDDVEALGEQVDNLALAFIAPLGADDRDYFGRSDE